MKNLKLRIIIVFSVITLLIISPIGSFGSINLENETSHKTNIMVKNAAICYETLNPKNE